MIFLDDLSASHKYLRLMTEGCRKLRIHKDVLDLGDKIIADNDKLEATAPFLFMPAFETWMEWETVEGKIGFFFGGSGQSVTEGEGFWACRRWEWPEDEPVIVALKYNIPEFKVDLLDLIPNMDFAARMSFAQTVSAIKPYFFTILALINSPKIIRSREIDVTKLNKRRAAMGRYLFHPHHEVRLNVDKRVITTVKGEGDGASKCLHFVRTHLRFVPSQGGYTLVHPHWRGDPALGIRDTHYAVDRQNSRWAE